MVTQLQIANEIHCFKKILTLTNKHCDPDSGSLWFKEHFNWFGEIREHGQLFHRFLARSPAELALPLLPPRIITCRRYPHERGRTAEPKAAEMWFIKSLSTVKFSITGECP